MRSTQSELDKEYHRFDKRYDNVYTDIACFDLDNSAHEGEGKVAIHLGILLSILGEDKVQSPE